MLIDLKVVRSIKSESNTSVQLLKLSFTQEIIPQTFTPAVAAVLNVLVPLKTANLYLKHKIVI